MVWVCLMGLVMPQTVLCQAELTDLWSLVCRKNMIVPVSVDLNKRRFLRRSVGFSWLWGGGLRQGGGFASFSSLSSI